MARKRIVLPDGSTAMVSDDVEGLDLSPLVVPQQTPVVVELSKSEEPSLPVKLKLYLWAIKEHQEFFGEFLDLASCCELNKKFLQDKTLDLTLTFDKDDRKKVYESVWKTVLALRSAAVDLKVLEVGTDIEKTYDDHDDVKLLSISVTRDDQLKFKFKL